MALSEFGVVPLEFVALGFPLVLGDAKFAYLALQLVHECVFFVDESLDSVL